MGLGQYLQDTRAELNHVAWPTRTQTIVYTVLVIALSIFIATYLGLFDYLFTSTLTRFVSGAEPVTVTQEPIQQPVSTSTQNQAPAVDINSIIPGQKK